MVEPAAHQLAVLEWSRYLQQRGHRLRRPASRWHVIRSRDRERVRYRWFVLVSQDAVRLLTPIERKQIARELRRAKGAGDRMYLVVVFEPPVSKAVVLPAKRAARMRRVQSAKGGIPWDW
jgi:hypothetical protein